MGLFKKNKNFFYAYAMLTGTIIGVGFFSLPYITSRAGILTVGAYFIFLGAISMLIHLFWAEVAAKTSGHHRLPGLAKTYLGKTWGRMATITAIGSLFGAILAYVILGADFSHALLNGHGGTDEWLHVILYCLFGAILIWRGNKIIAELEVGGMIALALVLVFLVWRASGHLHLENILALKGQVKNFFLPYGVVLFSLWGASAIPDIREVMGQDKKYFNRVIIWSGLTAIAVYFLFIIIILGVSGEAVDPNSLGGLGGILGLEMSRILLTMGIITTFTSYITLTLALNKLLIYDLGMNSTLALVLVAGVPMIFYFLGINDFIAVISFVGTVFLAIDGIFIVSIYRRVGRLTSLKRLGVGTMIVCFILGIIYEFYKIL